jgi:hypothetical protein
MTQTTTFPNLESLPNASTQALLYFSGSLGTLTEVDVVTSGSFSTQFYAENLGPSSSTISGTTSGRLSVNLPSGAFPVVIPAVTDSFDAAAYDGTLSYASPSGNDFAPATSNSAAQTAVLTSPAALAAFTGNFRIPVTVSGHATGSTTSSDGEISAGFTTQTSVTITVVYHYIPNLPSLNPPANPSPSPQSSGTSPTAAAPAAPQASSAGTASLVETTATQTHHAATHTKKKVVVQTATSSHKGAHHPAGGHKQKKPGGHSRDATSHLGK